jgi:hypothetical protein
MQARISRLFRTAAAGAVDLGGLLAKRAQNVQLGFRHGVKAGHLAFAYASARCQEVTGRYTRAAAVQPSSRSGIAAGISGSGPMLTQSPQR